MTGQLAVSRGYASAKEILECLNLQVRAEALLRKHFCLGEILFLRGCVDERQYVELVRAAQFANQKTQAIRGATAEDFELGAEAERSERAGSASDSWSGERPRLLGEALIQQGLATPAQVLGALDRQRAEDAEGKPHRKLGEILLAEKVVTEAELGRALKLVMEWDPTRHGQA